MSFPVINKPGRKKSNKDYEHTLKSLISWVYMVQDVHLSPWV
jgi:hypothetical protein